MKRTLKRELKVREMAIREGMEVSRVALLWYDAVEIVGGSTVRRDASSRYS